MFPVFGSNYLDEIALIAASVLWFVPELVLAHARRAGPQALVKDRASGMGVMLSIWLGVTASWICAYGASGFAIPVERGLLFVVGILLMLAGIAFRWYSIRVLGRFFTVVVAVQPGHSLVEQGPYRLIRHPSYSGALLTLFGFGLVFTNWLSLAAAMLFPLLGYWYRMYVEEQALLVALGSDYAEYMKRTKRIIPSVI
jgi:protein-S-isoprenylcysteine O-methyltransferase Ste14